MRLCNVCPWLTLVLALANARLHDTGWLMLVLALADARLHDTGWLMLALALAAARYGVADACAGTS